MADTQQLLSALAPVLAASAELDLTQAAQARAVLAARFPIDGGTWQALKALFVEGRQAGWLCHRENAGVRFSRVHKGPGLSVDAVHMQGPGPGHTHGKGEIDLCFAVSGEPRFDGQPEGFVVYPPGSWHVPTVTGGVMDILYLLPDGAITFEDKPR
jgi:hypothetical protein